MYRSITLRPSHHISFFGLSLLILSSFFLLVGTAEAKTVKRGVQSAPLEMAINIVGGSETCMGDAGSYPAGDGVKTVWAKSHKNADSPIRLLNAGASILATPGSYTFTCTDAVSGKSDSDTLVVNDCDPGETWDNSTHKCIPSAKPNLMVSAHTFPTGSIEKDKAVTLLGTAKNNGSASTGAGYNTNFSYSLNGGSWNNLPDKAKSALNAGATALQDSQNYTPTIVGTIRFQYCVDSDKTIDESDEGDNCVQSGSITVTPPGAETGDISSPGCSIVVGGSTCVAKIYWNTENFPPKKPEIKVDGAFAWDSLQSVNPNPADRSLGRGAHNFTLHNSSGAELDRATINIDCIAGATWNGTRCVAAAGPAKLIVCGPTNVLVGDTGTFTSHYWPNTSGGENCSNLTGSSDKTTGSTWGPTGSSILKVSNQITPNTRGQYTALAVGSETVVALYNPGGGAIQGTLGVTVADNSPLPRVDGQCGPAARNYGLGETSFSGNLCQVGAVSPASPAFPAFGATTNWQCQGSNGGTNDFCSATRATPPPPDFDLGDCTIGEEQGNCSAGASWDLQAGTSPYTVKNLTNGASISNPASTSAGWLTLDYGTNEGEADATGIGALTDYGYANCAYGLFWHNLINPKLCKKPPQISINPASSLVRKDDFAFIDVTVSATYTTRCDIVGGNPVPATFTFNGSISNRTYTQTVKTGPHKSTQVVEIECYVPELPGIPGSHATATTRISVLPNYQEL